MTFEWACVEHWLTRSRRQAASKGMMARREPLPCCVVQYLQAESSLDCTLNSNLNRFNPNSEKPGGRYQR